MKVNIKKELELIDRNNFDQVSDFVDKIVCDIWKRSENQVEIIDSMVRDYMVDLINPDLLN